MLRFIVWLIVLLPSTAFALEYKSTLAEATIFYDGPSTKSSKLFVVGKDYPVEVLVTVENMVKVRDASGSLAWVEKKALSDKRTLQIKVPVAEIMVSPDEKANVVFKAEQNVLLELLEPGTSGWAKIKHRDGQTGYIRIQQVWGL